MLRCVACVLLLLLGCMPFAAADSMEYEELYFELLDRTGGPEFDEAFPELPLPVRNLYLAAVFDMEIQNGGLLQYFANCGSESASQLSQSLRAVGLEPMAKLYDEFLAVHEIDASDLSDFHCASVEDFIALCTRYPESGTFDDAYMELWQTLDFNSVMLAYAAENLQ